MKDDDIIERHADLLAGVGAILWALGTRTLVPELEQLCSVEFAAGFGLVALGRWFRKLRQRKGA